MAKAKRARFKSTTVKTTVADIVSGSIGDLEALKEELEQWKENIEEKFSTTEKYSQLEEAVDALEISEPDIEDELGNIEVEYQTVNPKSIKSRSARCNEATRLLSAAIDALNAAAEDDDQLEGAEDLANELQEIVDTAEGVEFPGMF